MHDKETIKKENKKIIIMIISVFLLYFLLFFASKVFADYPSQAKTEIINNFSSSDLLNQSVFSTGDRTILNITINAQLDKDSAVLCDSDYLLKQDGTKFISVDVNYFCNSTISVNIYRYTTIIITYTDYNTDTTDGGVSVYNTNFTSGDMMICLLLFIIMILFLIYFLQKGISSQKVVRKYQGNNSPDGKEFYKI